MSGVENLSVLFTDMVGSTQLATSVPVETADEIRRTHFSLLRKAIAPSAGTEVKNLGDGLMVVFPLASSALAGAVSMQQTVEQHNRRSAHPVGLRVAISAGEVTEEGGDYFGDPVIEAARLCAKTQAGQILVADIVMMNAGRRNPYRFRRVGALQLKGLPAPVDTHEVDWEPLSDSDDLAFPGRLPLPPRLTARPRPGVVGRRRELVEIKAAYKRVTNSASREVVLVAGEAGQGKTTLAAEALRVAHGDGATVLFGRCDEDVGTSYMPFAEALDHYVAHAPEDMLRSYLDANGAGLSRLAPALHKRLGALPPLREADPDTERYLLYAGVLDLVKMAAQHTATDDGPRPVVLMLDDLQWADTASLELLRHLVKGTVATRLLIIGTYRDVELAAGHPLLDTLASMRREQCLTGIRLQGLGDEEVVQYLEASAGHDLTEDGVRLAHAVYRETDGNPFFVAEVVRDLTETGAVAQDESGRWVTRVDLDEMVLPTSLREVVASRVARVSHRAIRVLSVAAVIGRDFDIELLGAVTDTDADELLDLLDAAAGAALIRELPGSPGRYTFSHALIQHTLYQGLGATRRARTHQHVAEALEDMLGDRAEARLGELAHHYLLATMPSNPRKAVDYARRAGERALEALAPGDAVRYFDQALSLAESAKVEPPAYVDLLLGLGLAQRQAGIPEFRSTLLEAARRARELGDANRLAQAALANNRGIATALGKLDREKLEVLEAALLSLPAGDSPQRALLLSTTCTELAYGSFDQRLAMAVEAKAMARRLGTPTITIKVLNDCNMPLQVPQLHEERLHCSQEALELAKAHGDPVALYWAARWACTDALQIGEFEDARACIAITRRLTEELNQPTISWNTAYRETAHALIAGDTARADQLASEALQLGMDSGQPDAFAFYGAQLIVIRHQQGRLAELAELIADVATQNPDVPSYLAGLAVAYIEAGKLEEARQLVGEAERQSFQLPLDTAWMDGTVFYALAASELRLPSAAEQLLDILSPYHAQIPYDGLIPFEPVAVFLGALAALLERYAEAEAYFEEAMALSRRGEMRFALAQTQLLWARLLIQRGRPEDHGRAEQLCQQALTSAQENGYTGIKRRAEALQNR